MKILFITDEFYPDFGANTLIVKTLCEEFIKENSEVYVMPFNYALTLPKREKWNGINVIRIIPNDDARMFMCTLKQLCIWQSFKILRKYCSIRFFRTDKLKNKERIMASRVIKEWLEKEGIDIVISICCSIELSFPLYNLRKQNKLKCKWIFYMLDPFESHEYYRSIESIYKLRKLQHKIMKASDSVIATDLIYNDVALWEQADILEKIQIAHFPKILQPEISECMDRIKLSSNVINVVCTGSKNETVRNSEYTFDLCKRFEEEDILFHFVGIGWTKQDMERRGNVCLYSPRAWAVIQDMQLQADFLLNIGNKVNNQLPSKVLEYISSGVPILNIYKSEKCPTLKLLNNYDALNINESETVLDEAVDKVRQYIYSVHERKEFEKIKEEFSVYTPKYVAKQFMNLINGYERNFEDEKS